MEYYSAIKKEWIWLSSSEVDEPRACYTEWSSQKEKNKYHILMNIYGIQKNGTDEPNYRVGILRHREQMSGHSNGWKV